MDLIKFEVGKRFPLEDINNHFMNNSGASLSYEKESKSLVLYMCLPDVSERESLALSEDKIKFYFYENAMLDTHLMIVKVGDAFEMDALFNINVLDKDLDGLIEGNGFKVFLIEQSDKTLKAMRLLGLGSNFMKMLNSITKNDGRYTTEEYMEWINETYKRPLPLLISESKGINWNE